MPRRDRTYTGVDLIRFWAKNLDVTEQKDVLVTISVAIAVGSVRKARSKLLLAIISIATRFAPQPWGLILRQLLRLFKIRTFEEEALDFYERAERVLAQAGLTLGDLNAIISETEDA